MTRWRVTPKYRNNPVVVDNVRFDSRKEAAHYQQLTLLQRAGAICRLECHPRFDLHATNGAKIGRFTADFLYVDPHNGEVFVLDVKSPITRRETSYRLRKKLVEAEHGITVQEV